MHATDAAQPCPAHKVSVMSLSLSPRQRGRCPFCCVVKAQRSVVTTMTQMTPRCSCKSALNSLPLLSSLYQISLCNRSAQDYIMVTRLWKVTTVSKYLQNGFQVSKPVNAVQLQTLSPQLLFLGCSRQ